MLDYILAIALLILLVFITLGIATMFFFDTATFRAIDEKIAKLIRGKESVWATLKVIDIVDELAEEQKKSQTEDLAAAIANGAYCRTCKHLPNEDCDCDIVFTGYEPKDNSYTGGKDME